MGVLERIIIEEKQSKAARLCLTGILLMVLCAMVSFFGVCYHMGVFTFVGGVGVIIFLGISIFFISKLLKPKALFTITMDGVENMTRVGEILFLPFDDIKQFYKVNMFGHEMIGVIPKNMEQFIHKLPAAKQRIARGNVKMSLPPVTLEVDMAKDMSIDDIISLLQKRLSDYSRLYD